MANKRLLIIEDDVDVAEMLIMFFKTQQYEVLHADMGSEGINLARSKFPNLILLDVMLPDMVGFDVCNALRTTNLTKYIPIIFLTQRDGRADKVAGLQLGADDYITKPFDIEELRLRVQGSMRRATRDQLHETRTGLPTGAFIREEYDKLRDKEGWHYLDIQISGYTAFRDQYGFLAADESIQLASSILTQALAAYGTSDDFIGVSSENSFAVFTNAADIKALQSSIHANFTERVVSLYNFIDADRGYLIVDENERVPLMALDINPFTRSDNVY